MRATSFVVVIGCLLATRPATAEQFPYTAYVVASDVYVRSGPGRNYYPTAKFAKGDAVEVYRHDPGGWCAIRPPEDSFSWVSSRFVRQTDDHLGVVLSDEVVARVGSSFSTVRDVIQVRLEKDELVEILDEHNSGGQTWYKIAPPSGEFRWVSRRYLDDKPLHDGVSQPRSENDDLLPGKDYADEDYGNDAYAEAGGEPRDERGRDRQDPARRRSSSDRDEELRRVRDEVHAVRNESNPRSSADRSRTVDYVGEHRDRREPDDWQGERQVAHERPQRRAEPGRMRVADERSADQFQLAIDDIEAELSAMVAEEPTVWTFYDLKDRADRLVDTAGTALERGQAQRVLNKIARLDDIRKRYETINQVQAETDRRIGSWQADRGATANRATGAVAPAGYAAKAPTAAAPPESSPPTAGDTPASQAFDGQGILRPVVSRRLDAPRYALVDELGVVQSFISAAPGLNLQPYLGQPVGVTGTRGFMPELRKPHVMVQRIQPLKLR